MTWLWTIFGTFFALGIVIGLLTAWFKSPRAVGKRGENRVIRKLNRLPSEFVALHNITLPSGKGTTQIDHCLVSPYGIFVIETKTLSGVIAGSLAERTWTQHLGRNVYELYNPLQQNQGHIRVVAKTTGVSPDIIANMVVLAGEGVMDRPVFGIFDTPSQLYRHLKTYKVKHLTSDQVDKVVEDLQAAALEPGRKTDREHVKNVKQARKHAQGPTCPECHVPMRKRQNSRTGQEFWGCVNYPECTETKQS